MDVLADAARTINRLAAEDALPVRIAQVLPLARATVAHRLIGAPAGARPRGRILVSVR